MCADYPWRLTPDVCSPNCDVAGLLAFLLIVLEWTRPGLLSPLRPICDLRVLNHFIQEARDAEVAMVRGKCTQTDRRERHTPDGVTYNERFMYD